MKLQTFELEIWPSETHRGKWHWVIRRHRGHAVRTLRDAVVASKDDAIHDGGIAAVELGFQIAGARTSGIGRIYALTHVGAAVPAHETP